MKPLLHETTQQQLEAAQANTGGYIFFGPKSIGKFTTAIEFARELNCLGDTDMQVCASCLQFKSGNFADLIILKPEDKPSITVAQVRDLSKQLALSVYGKETIRFVIIDQGESLSHQAQNALLKFLEEPPVRTRVILITSKIEALLPTVKSRLGQIYFSPNSTQEILRLLVERYGITSDVAAELAEQSMGIPGLAIDSMRNSTEQNDEISIAQVEKVLKGDIFSRLMWVKSAVDAKTDINPFMRYLQAIICSDIQSDKETLEVAAQRLEAIKVYYYQIDANVGSKPALERLMVEL